MSEKEKPRFTASFVYTDAVLRDFEALYLEKKKISPAARVVLGLLGAAGAAYFGWMLWREGAQFTRICYLLICSVLLVLAFPGSGRRPDDTVRKYRAAYLNKRANFSFGADALEMKLEGQKTWARSKYQEIYGLFDTALCFYILVKGRAYYILPKEAVAAGESGELEIFLQKKCKKHFQHFDLSDSKGACE